MKEIQLIQTNKKNTNTIKFTKTYSHLTFTCLILFLSIHLTNTHGSKRPMNVLNYSVLPSRTYNMFTNDMFSKTKHYHVMMCSVNIYNFSQMMFLFLT